jgi:hypothetical protein
MLKGRISERGGARPRPSALTSHSKVDRWRTPHTPHTPHESESLHFSRPPRWRIADCLFYGHRKIRCGKLQMPLRITQQAAKLSLSTITSDTNSYWTPGHARHARSWLTIIVQHIRQSVARYMNDSNTSYAMVPGLQLSTCTHAACDSVRCAKYIRNVAVCPGTQCTQAWTNNACISPTDRPWLSCGILHLRRALNAIVATSVVLYMTPYPMVGRGSNSRLVVNHKRTMLRDKIKRYAMYPSQRPAGLAQQGIFVVAARFLVSTAQPVRRRMNCSVLRAPGIMLRAKVLHGKDAITVGSSLTRVQLSRPPLLLASCGHESASLGVHHQRRLNDVL